jgi:hypothetical protein
LFLLSDTKADFLNCVVERGDKLAGAQRRRSKALLTLPESGQPPATFLHRVGIEQRNAGSVEQAKQRKKAAITQPHRAEH